ncbi:MAG: leucyl/phenylalanyl-tRNA--protein transferase [Pseudomonadota bacterium]
MRFVLPRLADDPEAPFPDPKQSDHPDGLIAIGGDLSQTRLLNAYRNGIFPWFEQHGPILWWCPSPRAVLIPGHVYIPRRLQRTLNQQRYRVTLNQAFGQVIEGCATARGEHGETWITAGMLEAYARLHQNGYAHSLEVWQDGQLIGGIYGVAIGKIFFAESKFHIQRDASKVALIELMNRLEQQDYLLCDCQLWNPHLEQFNIRMMDRSDFLRLLQHGVKQPGHFR